MRNRMMKLMAGVTALAALAFGGSAIASATQSPSKTSPKAAQTRVDNDAIEQENGADDATEAAESDESEAAEGPESEKGEKDGTEVPGDDGPGGHADEPGDPDADHQFEGEE